MITNPYSKNIEYTRISLDAYYMNSNIKNNLLNILKKKLENKCNKNGYRTEEKLLLFIFNIFIYLIYNYKLL